MKWLVLTVSVVSLLLVSAGCAQPETALERGAGSSAAARTQLTTGPANDSFVEFSPDGSQIAFISDRDGGLKVWTMPAQGGDAMPLTDPQNWAVLPVWSPGGTRIAYLSDKDEPTNIWVVSTAGGDPVRLTSDPSLVFDPQWSPDGSKLLYSNNTGGEINL